MEATRRAVGCMIACLVNRAGACALVSAAGGLGLNRSDSCGSLRNDVFLLLVVGDWAQPASIAAAKSAASNLRPPFDRFAFLFPSAGKKTRVQRSPGPYMTQPGAGGSSPRGTHLRDVKRNHGLIETQKTHLVEFVRGVIFVQQRWLSATQVGRCTAKSIVATSKSGLRQSASPDRA